MSDILPEPTNPVKGPPKADQEFPVLQAHQESQARQKMVNLAGKSHVRFLQYSAKDAKYVCKRELLMKCAAKKSPVELPSSDRESATSNFQ